MEQITVVIGDRLGKGQKVAAGAEKAGARAVVVPGVAADMKLGDMMKAENATFGISFCGSGGAGARDGFMFALSLAPGCIFSMGLIEVFSKMGVMEAFQKVFTPILRPLLGLPGSCGLAFVNSLNGSDIAAVLTKELYDNGQITDDERTIFVSFMYPGSAPIGNMISTQAAVLPIAVMAMGPMILLVIFCKLVGANIVRLIVMRGKKKNAEVAK